MRRIQFIELHDQPWFPKSLRDDVIDALQFGFSPLKAYASIAPLLHGALDSSPSQSVVDMCSGGGGPWLYLSRMLSGKAHNIHVCLTDKYPNIRALQNMSAASEDRITFSPDSVDAMNVPGELKGFRTIFTSFHHFSPPRARAILQNAVDDGQNIGIFEMTKRSPLDDRTDVPLGTHAVFLHSVDPPVPLVETALDISDPSDSFCPSVRWNRFMPAILSA